MVAVHSEIAGGDDEMKVCIVFKPRAQVAMEALLDYCQERMPYFAVPRYIEFVSELPKTPTGKIQKHNLRGAGITANTWDRDAAGYKVRRR